MTLFARPEMPVISGNIHQVKRSADFMEPDDAGSFGSFGSAHWVNPMERNLKRSRARENNAASSSVTGATSDGWNSSSSTLPSCLAPPPPPPFFEPCSLGRTQTQQHKQRQSERAVRKRGAEETLAWCGAPESLLPLHDGDSLEEEPLKRQRAFHPPSPPFESLDEDEGGEGEGEGEVEVEGEQDSSSSSDCAWGEPSSSSSAVARLGCEPQTFSFPFLLPPESLLERALVDMTHPHDAHAIVPYVPPFPLPTAPPSLTTPNNNNNNNNNNNTNHRTQTGDGEDDPNNESNHQDTVMVDA